MEIPLTGTVQLFTIATIDTYGEKLEKPMVVGFINIDTTDSTLLGIIETENYNKNLFNAKVQAVLKPKNEREGMIKDILHFKLK